MSWVREITLSWFQVLAVKVLKSGQVPKHVAVIMDGNRRYANKKGVEKILGHTVGFTKLTETLQWCILLGIPEITVYAFSIENFKRSAEEVNGLLELALSKFRGILEERELLKKHGICIRIIGNFSKFSDKTRKIIADAMLATKDNNKVYLNIAFAYTSRDELTQGIKKAIGAVKDGDVLPEDIDENLISKCLYTFNSPNPDLLIRTSGEVRFSDFLMWQISNACIYFADVLWPEFNVWTFLGALFYYQRCQADLQHITKPETKAPVVWNTRQLTYINKLHHDRNAMLEKMSLVKS